MYTGFSSSCREEPPKVGLRPHPRVLNATALLPGLGLSLLSRGQQPPATRCLLGWLLGQDSPKNPSSWAVARRNCSSWSV